MMPHGDRGSYSILFIAFLLGICGVGVLVVDVGRAYVEGRQVQNGAQIAALRIAETCAIGPCQPTAGNTLANGNALDGATQVEPPICGTAPGLGGCASDGVRPRFGCGPVSGSAPYVQVRTRTRDAAGGNELPGLFSRVLAPGSTSSVRACARAAYGNPSGLTGQLPLAMSSCEFNYWRNLYGLPGTGEALMYFHSGGGNGATNPSGCPQRNTSSNSDIPGGFGWLLDTSCEIATTVTGDALANNGTGLGQVECTAAQFAAMHNQVVNVPIYSNIYKDAAGKDTYDIVGYAAFRLTAYRLNGGNAQYLRRRSSDNSVPCTPQQTCIAGFFTIDAVSSSGPLVAGPNLGSLTTRLVG